MHPLLDRMNLRGYDSIQTPPSAVRPLLKYIPKNWIIWECACGRGNLVREFIARGYTTVGSDIENDLDFLSWEPEHWSCIITNPPYSLKDKFLARCYDLQQPFALLLPLTALGAKKRQNLFRLYGIEIVMLGGRVHFDTGTGKKAAWFESAWFTWGLNLPSQIVFEQMED